MDLSADSRFAGEHPPCQALRDDRLLRVLEATSVALDKGESEDIHNIGMTSRDPFTESLLVAPLTDRKVVALIVRRNQRPCLDMRRRGDQHVGERPRIDHAPVGHDTVTKFSQKNPFRLRMTTVEAIIIPYLHHQDQKRGKSDRKPGNIQEHRHLKTPEHAEKITYKCLHNLLFIYP